MRVRLTVLPQSRNFVPKYRRPEFSGAVAMHQDPAPLARLRARNSGCRRLWRVVAACGLAIILLQPCGAAAARFGRVTHVVIFWLKRPNNTADRAAIARASEAFRKMAGVASVEAGDALPVRRSGIEERFDLSVVFTFQDRAALERFEKDPRHAAAIKSVPQTAGETLCGLQLRRAD